MPFATRHRRRTTTILGLMSSLAVIGILASPSGAVAASKDVPSVTGLPGRITDVARIGGADRFAVAVAVSQHLPSSTNHVLYIVSGAKFPDALSAGPSAIDWQGSLLLVPADHLPLAVAEEIERLDPHEIHIVGGRASISQDVEDQIRRLVPSARTERIDGADRYEVSRNLAWDFPAVGVAHPYLATGATFADALSAGPIAGASQNTVMLIEGASAQADMPTLASLTSISTASMTVVGGPASVSESYLTSLKAVAPVGRVGGADRYEASTNINSLSPDAFTSADTAYLATGLNFPDALAGGVLAGRTESPLYVVPGTCVPEKTLIDMVRLRVQHVVLLGGTDSLSPAIESLTPCP